MNVEEDWVGKATYVLNGKVRNLPMKYLGLPIGTDTKRMKTWELVLDIVKKRLSRWTTKFLSMVGRLVLLKYILSSIPVYFLSFFKVLIGIISNLRDSF